MHTPYAVGSSLHSIQHIKYRLSKLLKEHTAQGEWESSRSHTHTHTCFWECWFAWFRPKYAMHEVIGGHSKHTTLSDLCPVLLCSISVHAKPNGRTRTNHHLSLYHGHNQSLRFLKSSAALYFHLPKNSIVIVFQSRKLIFNHHTLFYW